MVIFKTMGSDVWMSCDMFIWTGFEPREVVNFLFDCFDIYDGFERMAQC